ncbi:MAG: hypothetical protein WB245_04340, partial [Acidimicrobiia bacterium]
FTIVPCEASTVVVSGQCSLNAQGAPVGEVQVVIDPVSGATVVLSGPGGPYDFSGSGGTQDLAPGDYTWQATAGPGFALTGDSSGEFTVEPCAATVIVTHGDCVAGQGGAVGSVTVVIDPDSGAVVTVSGPGGPHQFDGSGGTQTLAPGDYSWLAAPGDGFTLEGETSGEFTVEPCTAGVIVTHGGCSLNVQGAPIGEVQVVIDPVSGATVVVSGPGGPYDFSGSGGTQDLAPGDYTWQATAGPGFALTGETSGEFTIAPCDASLVVSLGECELLDGPLAPVTVFIDTESGATVTIFDSEHQMVASFDGTGGVAELPPGAYTWAAEPGDGFQFPDGQATSGSFTIAPCVATVLVTHGNCVQGSQSAYGSVDVSILPDSAAIVTVSEVDVGVVGIFGGAGGSGPLAAGDYEWVADPAPGFVLQGNLSGEFTVVECPDEVLAEEIDPTDSLPFTGMDSEMMFGASVVMLGMGLALVRYARRRGQD